MMFDVTRDIVSDLWPLTRSGDASAASRSLVDRYLAEDRDFAATLQRGQQLAGAMPPLRLSPDAERRLLDDARERARLKMLVIGGAIALTLLVALVALGGALLMIGRAV